MSTRKRRTVPAAVLQTETWYELARIRGYAVDGRMGEIGEPIPLGDHLLAGVLVVLDMLDPGTYAVLRCGPWSEHAGPYGWAPVWSDWGTLWIASPNRWRLRRADGRECVVGGRFGEAVHLGGLR